MASTLGEFISERMTVGDFSNRSLAAAAGVSESAVRNLRKLGLDPSAKDPDASTLTRVAKALDVDALWLFRLAGYIPPEPAAPSPRAAYLANLLDRLPTPKQEAVLAMLEALVEGPRARAALQAMRGDVENPVAGLDLDFSTLARVMANQLVAACRITEPQEVEKIRPGVRVLNTCWGALPAEVQERLKGLIRRKLSLEYDPTMVDPKWRG